MGATLLDRTTGPQTEQDIAAAGDTRYLLDTRLLNINGGVEVSQELGLTGLTLVSGGANIKYIADMWQAQYIHAANTAVVTTGQIAASSFPVALAGFPNGAQIKATTALTAPANGDIALLRTSIEGYRIARLGWGAANPSSISYGFWFYATASGTIFSRIINGAANRAYHHEHAVVGGIWNWCSATVAGDTTGTWTKDNTVGMIFDIFVTGKSATPAAPDAWSGTLSLQTTNSTNLLAANNNLCIATGLVIAPGTAIPNSLRLFGNMRTFDEELLLSQRYWEKLGDGSTRALIGAAITSTSGAAIRANWQFKVQKRVAPTIAIQSSETSGTFVGLGSGSVTAYCCEFTLDTTTASTYGAIKQATADARL